MSEINTINGVPLSDIESTEEALSYLKKDYNAGRIHFNADGNVLCVTFRSNYVPTGKLRAIRQAQGIEITYIGVSGDGQAYIELRNAD